MVLATAEGVAAITAGATLLAASGLAYVTIHTTKLRLGEERERQKQALVAEAERQQASLLHDRELVDIADLRQLLDAGATALDKGAKAQDTCTRLIDMWPSIADAPKFTEMVQGAKDELEVSAPAVIALGARLRVRLGPADPITEAFAAASLALGDTESMTMRLRIKITKPGDEADKAKQATSDYRDAVRAFTTAAVKRAGTAASRAGA